MIVKGRGGDIIKVGDLVLSRISHGVALVLCILPNNRFQIIWLDTMEIDSGGATVFNLFSALDEPLKSSCRETDEELMWKTWGDQ